MMIAKLAREIVEGELHPSPDRDTHAENSKPISRHLHDKHLQRKRGRDAYYGRGKTQ
jgi:hypothetical protein